MNDEQRLITIARWITGATFFPLVDGRIPQEAFSFLDPSDPHEVICYQLDPSKNFKTVGWFFPRDEQADRFMAAHPDTPVLSLPESSAASFPPGVQ